jgi:hypothetical protein
MFLDATILHLHAFLVENKKILRIPFLQFCFLFKYFLVANAFCTSQVNTEIMHIKLIVIHNSIGMFPLKPYALTGFEPRSSIP